MSIDKEQSQQRKLIWRDGVVCWLYPDDSHRGLDASDTLLINNAIEAYEAAKVAEQPVKVSPVYQPCGKKMGYRLIEDGPIITAPEQPVGVPHDMEVQIALMLKRATQWSVLNNVEGKMAAADMRAAASYLKQWYQIYRQSPMRESGEVEAWRNRCHAADREYQELMEKHLAPKIVDIADGCAAFREATNTQDLEIGIGYEDGVKAIAKAWGLK